jgi:hypothetical protein
MTNLLKRKEPKMSNSKLVTYTKLSPNYSSGRVDVRAIVVHYVCGACDVYTVGEIFAPRSRQASSNYCVDLNGRVGMYVEEKNRSWCSSSSWADNRAITIEVSNFADGSTSATGWRKLVELMVDICKRNGIKDFRYTGTTEGQLWAHRWFGNTDCPGAWLYARFPQLAEEVNARLHEGQPDLLTVDGWWGRNTTRKLQEVLGTPVDGEVWHQWPGNKQPACTSGWIFDTSCKGSSVIRALQKKLGCDEDGILGTETIRKLQAHLGTPIDGRLDGPSTCIKEMQRRLNKGTF